ncbi:Anthocyanidin 3-O-glucosyltransferase [Dichanthelium oligosanthes]|uniref:Anthocyanidin 3-O-glucosyltransferase n=1 Tax=Dichanthelium oligosanthes TaxID=888268 RepID=A0A1E5UJ62_9POAL|nr:Anthocyanidin 3-O-glucosyltransferase [Dichanthelium oligosanthes]
MAGGGKSAAGEAMHVVMLPWLAFGHISPFAQLARKLGSVEGGLRVTFLTAGGNLPRVEAMLASVVGAVSVVPLHLPHVPGLPEGAASTAELTADAAELLKVALDGTRAQVSALLSELHPDAMLIDFSTPWVCDIAAPLGVKVLHFSVFSAAAGAYTVVPARCLHGAPPPSARDLMSAPAGFPEGSALATIPAYQAADLTYIFTSFDGQPCVYDRALAGIKACDGIVMKSCAEMEGPYINYLSTEFGRPVLLAGPVVPDPPQGELEERWANWLSSFPENAVVFASFGSETFLPAAEATELLLGLEATNRPFLAVLNFPKGADMEAELQARIPSGFEERVKGRGVVHTGWVQQQHILRHRSVGCYLNHAGFSSAVEGLVAGCRLVLLPMKGDQYLNAALLARELRVGVEVTRRGEDGWFGRQDVSDAVALAVADGGEGERGKWREFLTDDAVQKRGHGEHRPSPHRLQSSNRQHHQPEQEGNHGRHWMRSQWQQDPPEECWAFPLPLLLHGRN